MAATAYFLFMAAQATSPLGAGMAPAQDAMTAGAPAIACMDVLGAVGSTPSNVQNFDGKKLKKPSDIEKIRKSVKSGEPILIDGGNFTGADFRKAKIKNVCFRGAELSGTRWDKADANGVAFVGSNLEKANLSGAIMSRVLFRDAKLANAQAIRSDFSGGRIDGGWAGSLTNFNLDSAQLTAFDFNCFAGEQLGCPWDRAGITARGADLTGAKLSSFSFWELNVQGAKLDRTEINVDTLRFLGGASISGPIYVRGNTHMVALDQAEIAGLVTAMPVTLVETAAPDCEVEKPQKLDDLLCMNRNGKIAKLSRDIATFEYMDPAATSAGARIHNSRMTVCFTSNVANLPLCVENSLRERREKLAQSMAMRSPPKSGEKALFAAVSQEMKKAIATQPQLARLSAPIAGSTSAYILVQIDSRGSTKIRGQAVGGNGESCALSVPSARRNAANGWLGASSMTKGPRTAATSPIPVLRMWKDQAEVYPALGEFDDLYDARISEFITCPANNFATGILERIPISDLEFDKMWTKLESGTP